MSTRAQARDARRREVMRAAWKLFAENGFDRTTIRQIAERAGVSVGTVMNVGDKTTLLLDLMEAAIAERMTEPPTHRDDAATTIWLRLEAYFDFFASVPRLAKAYGRALFTAAGPNHHALTTQAEAFTKILADDIIGHAPRVSAADAAQAAHAIFAGYILAVATWGSDAAPLDVVTAALRDQVAWQLERFAPADGTENSTTDEDSNPDREVS